jgi:hypothetical protein
MDTLAVTKLIRSPWVPAIYTWQELSDLLKISELEAKSVCFSVNGEPKLLITHHDLVRYLIDLRKIVEVPYSVDQLNSKEKWLLSQGWKLDFDREIYRWKNENFSVINFDLRSALMIQLLQNKRNSPNQTPGVTIERLSVTDPLV